MSDYGFILEPGTGRQEYVRGGTEGAAQVIAALNPTGAAERAREESEQWWEDGAPGLAIQQRVWPSDLSAALSALPPSPE